MNDITHDEYEKVLKYIETTNQQNFDHAVEVMKQFQFNLEMAINNRFQQSSSHRQNQYRPPANHQNDEEIIKKFIEYTQRKNQQWNIFTIIFDLVKNLMLFLLQFLINFIPSSISIKFFGSPFEKIYFEKLNNSYKHKKLSYYLPKTKHLNSKSVLLIISPKKASNDLIGLLNNPEISKRISTSFFLTGYVAEDKQLSTIQNCKQPQIIALRMNIFEEIVQIKRQKDIKNVTAEVLYRWAHEGSNLFKRDNNVLIKYRNYLARFYGQMHEEEEEQEVSLVQRQRDTHQIKQQNQMYRQVEQKTQQSKKLQEEMRKKKQKQDEQRQQLMEERKIRKMSIPDEPMDGEIIRIAFRCPNGSTIMRNFQATQKLQLIYHWVQVNEEIQFQDERRHFQIMYSYPPQPLSSKKENLLSEVFQSSQQKVVIREL